MKRRYMKLLSIIFAVMIVISGCAGTSQTFIYIPETVKGTEYIESASDTSFKVLNNNVPEFTEGEITTDSFEQYSELDELGRCGAAFACIGTDLMPTEERGSISQVKPTGWQSVKYDFVDGKYLYNRCHLIGWQLTAENANKQNLITGTRHMNLEMLAFENDVADYVKSTEKHVMYRVTPVFEGDNLVASGVQMEGWSVEDDGKGICFNVYVYNIQPGIKIDYATGDSIELSTADSIEDVQEYILNTNSKKFHLPSCDSVNKMKEENKQEYTGSRDNLISQGYSPCSSCKP